jgi:hypothetical protein
MGTYVATIETRSLEQRLETSKFETVVESPGWITSGKYFTFLGLIPLS